jgi:hypothetical protein
LNNFSLSFRLHCINTYKLGEETWILLLLHFSYNYSVDQACPTWSPWYTFLAPYFTLPALTLIRISRKKYFWITVCFNFFRSTPINTVFPLLKSCFLLYPSYCPPNPTLPSLH